jgi:hypothetical protein
MDMLKYRTLAETYALTSASNWSPVPSKSTIRFFPPGRLSGGMLRFLYIRVNLLSLEGPAMGGESTMVSAEEVAEAVGICSIRVVLPKFDMMTPR